LIPNIYTIQQKKKKNEKIVVLTAYDLFTAKICNDCQIDIALVGDSAGMVSLGYPSTVSVTMDEMVVFCKGVVNGAKNCLIVADMPFGSYQVDASLAIANAVKFIKLGCHAVKIEGGLEVVPLVRRMSEYGIPVMGHIGLQPQTTVLREGYRVQGATGESAISLYNQAIELERAGAFSIVLELVTKQVAELISKSVNIPTIGIGSGGGCDGQVLVYHDLVGMFDKFKPKFVKKYLDVYELNLIAVKNYRSDVTSKTFPGEEHTFLISDNELKIFSDFLKTKTKPNFNNQVI
jgi:3-methyl-2-oxobutanoate hydroxymethyltransferase